MASDYPPPLVIPPRVLPHKQTFILLHGRGSSGDKFGPVLLDTPISSIPAQQHHPSTDARLIQPAQTPMPTPRIASHPAQTLATAFPHARFVFPTAARRRATIYRRAYTRQWFDNWTLSPPHATERSELQAAGLRETTAYLHGLLRAEIAILGPAEDGAERVVFGGLSQGCAASLVALLLWEGPALGAAVGMCGWLPFEAGFMREAGMAAGAGAGAGDDAAGMSRSEGGMVVDDGDNLFERDEDDEGWREGLRDEDGPAGTKALRWLRDELEVLASESKVTGGAFVKTPVFLGHGVEDDRVSVILGRNAAACLGTLGAETVVWKEYEDLGHWYSGRMLEDMVGFLRSSDKWAGEENAGDMG